MDQPLTELFRHNRWANLRLLDVCSHLGDGVLDAAAPGTYGRVRDTLVHIVAAEGRYVAGLTERPLENPLREDAPFPGFDELRARADRTGVQLTEIAERTPAAQLLRGSRRGQTYTIEAAVFLVQAVNHGTEHRAHVVSILSQQGVEPPQIDGWAYALEQGAVQEGS